MRKFLYTLGFLLISPYLIAQINSEIDIKKSIQDGTVKVSYSTFDIGDINNVFDNNYKSFSRSANINPLIITLEFTNSINIVANEILMTYGNGKWIIESASKLEDLNSKSGTYIKSIDRAILDGIKDSVKINKVNCKYLRLQLYRSTVDNYVHINEWKIFGELRVQKLNFSKTSYSSLIPTENIKLESIASDTISKVNFIVPNEILMWNSSNENVISVSSAGILKAKSIGTSVIKMSYGSIQKEYQFFVEDDYNSPDLSISYIKRLPEIDYVQNSTNPTVDGWPKVGESIKWRAYFKNWSPMKLDNIEYSWYLNGKEISKGIINNIQPYSLNYIDYESSWTFNRDELRFVIDTKNSLKEKIETNNDLLVYTNSITLNLYVEETLYKYFRKHQSKLNAGTNSFEDWAQISHVKRWNKMFAEAIYPESPNGVLDRIRIDSIIILPDNSLPLNGGLPSNNPNTLDRKVDLQWGFASSMLNQNPYTDTINKTESNPFYFEGSLLHELGHARYLIDVYGFDVSKSQVNIKENGQLVAGTSLMPIKAWDVLYYNKNQGLMGGDYTKIDKYTSMCLNLIKGKRALCGNMNGPCNIGIFLNDLPTQNIFTIKDKTGVKLSGANIKIFQATQNNDWYGKNFDDVPDLIFTTNTLGQFDAGSNPFTKNNKIIHTYGFSNGVIIIRIEYKNDVSFVFFEVTDFNIEYWKGNKEKANYEIVVNKNFTDIDKKDTTVCPGSPVTLNAKYDTTGAIIKSRKFLWSTGDTTASITVRPVRTTKYYVTVTVENVSRKDSVTITVFQTPVFNPLADTTRPASSVTLNAGTGFTRYTWSTGATTQSITAAANGKYKVTVTTAQGCVLADSTIVQLPELINLFIPVVQGQCGATIDVPVKAYAVKNLLTMQGSIVWNAADLRFQGIAGLGPVSLGMTASNFGISQTTSGILTFSWNDATLKGVTLPDTAVLFVLRFTVLGSLSRSIPLSITGSPTPLEFYDSYYRKKAISVRNGAVNLVCLATLTGRIISPLDGGITGVEMSLTGTENKKVITDKNGIYQFKVIPGNYIITPGKNNEKTKTNGISTLDLALIQSHVLNTLPLNSPYKVIAADADNSSTVSTVDVVYIRRMLLGIDTTLPGNRTWAFVDSSQTFANPMSPFPYNRNRTITGLAGIVNQTFRAIKIGDVNWDRNPLIDQPMMEDTMKLYYEAGDVSNGEVKFRVRAKDVRAVMGFQYTLQWTQDQMEFLGIGENPLSVSFGERWTDEGYLVMSWNDPQAMGISLSEGELMFELRFALRGSSAQTSLQAGSWKVASEVFNKDYQTIHLKMEALKTTFSQPLADDQIRVYPNPVENVVNVQWNASSTGKGYVRILDATGRKMLEQKVDVLQGLNSYRLTLDRKIIGQGNYLIQIESEGRSRTSRIIMAK